MKKQIFTIIFGLFSMLFLKAQSLDPDVISTSGDHFQGTGTSLSWTLGEPVTETSAGSNAIITQGFQQGNYTILSVSVKPSPTMSVSVYPNPVVDIMNIVVRGSGETIYICLSDITGKTLLNKKTNEAKTQINMKQYPTSDYLLTIKNNQGEIIRTFKVLKSTNY